jgi:hypothetical protein
MASGPKPAVASKRGRNKEVGEVDAIVGQRIRLRRTVLQLSLSALAKKIGVAQQQLHKYEIGQNRVSASRLHDLSVALKIPVGWFFQNVPPGTLATLGEMVSSTRISSNVTPSQNARSDVVALLTCYEDIRHPGAKELLLAIARLLSQLTNPE